MNYKNLKNYPINLTAREIKEFDADSGVIFVPQTNTKIFLHWMTDTGKIYATHTLLYPTLVQNKLKIINGPDDSQILVIELG
jgi:hypothetical protein